MTDPLSTIHQTPLPQIKAAAPKDLKTAQDFEAVFIAQMTQLMLENVEQGEFSGGHSEQIFRGMLAEHLGSAMAARGGLGLAPMVMDQIIRLQEGSNDGHGDGQ